MRSQGRFCIICRFMLFIRLQSVIIQLHYITRTQTRSYTMSNEILKAEIKELQRQLKTANDIYFKDVARLKEQIQWLEESREKKAQELREIAEYWKQRAEQTA